MARGRAAVVRARAWRARRRVVVSVSAVATAARCWPGPVGWTVGLVAAAGLMLFEAREWWDEPTDGKEAGGPASAPSGPGRFTEPGPIGVRVLRVGERPEVVARRLRAVTTLDDAAIQALMGSVPTALPATLSLRSAELVVDALRKAGADARVLIQGNLQGAG